MDGAVSVKRSKPLQTLPRDFYQLRLRTVLTPFRLEAPKTVSGKQWRSYDVWSWSPLFANKLAIFL